MANNYEVMKRYMGRKEKFYPDPENKEEFIELSPIYGDKAAEIFFLMSRFEGMDEKGLGKAMDAEVSKVITDLVTYAIQKAIPQATEEERKEFINTYYFQIFQKIMEMNVPKGKK